MRREMVIGSTPIFLLAIMYSPVVLCRPPAHAWYTPVVIFIMSYLGLFYVDQGIDPLLMVSHYLQWKELTMICIRTWGLHNYMTESGKADQILLSLLHRAQGLRMGQHWQLFQIFRDEYLHLLLSFKPLSTVKL